MSSLRQQLFRVKPVPKGDEETGSELKRTIGFFSLTMIGVGATIGTGIFFILSESVPVAGPAVIWSFVIAGVVAGLAVICYAELAGSVPVSGSSYSYAYATLGELPAMGVAACLLLEYGVAGAAVAVGWSQYVNQLLFNLFGFKIPDALAYAPEEGGIVNLPAIILLAMCCFLLVRGTGESVVANTVMVCIKLGVLVFFVVVGLTGWNADNFANFAPFGLAGVVSGSGIIFFTYVGMDSVATAGDETKNPKKTMPRASSPRSSSSPRSTSSSPSPPSAPSRGRSSRARTPACRRSWRTSSARPGRAPSSPPAPSSRSSASPSCPSTVRAASCSPWPATA